MQSQDQGQSPSRTCDVLFRFPVAFFGSPLRLLEGTPPAARLDVERQLVALARAGGPLRRALAAVAGVMYLIQERQLKRKKLGALFHRLPNIDVLDELNYRCLTIGFPLPPFGVELARVVGVGAVVQTGAVHGESRHDDQVGGERRSASCSGAGSNAVCLAVPVSTRSITSMALV